MKQNTKKDAPPYSPPIRVVVNALTGDVTVDDRAERAAATDHDLLVKRILRTERTNRRRLFDKQRPAPLNKPPDADRMLAQLASCYAPVETVTNDQIMRTCDCTKGKAIALRLWARQAGLWPYLQATGSLGMRRKGVEP